MQARSPNSGGGWRRPPSLARLNAATLYLEQPLARAIALRRRRLATGKRQAAADRRVRRNARRLSIGARMRGYAGVSSKSCKGIYKSLLNARALRAMECRWRDAALFRVGRRSDHAGRPRGAAGSGAGLRCSACDMSNATAITTSTVSRDRARTSTNSRLFSSRTPACTSTVTAASGSRFATGASICHRWWRPGSRSGPNPDWTTLEPLGVNMATTA